MSLTRSIAPDTFALELGMPHLGRSGLNESALLKSIGHDRWQALEKLGGVRSSDIRDAFDNRLYATFCFVELELAPETPLSAFDENDRLDFARDLSHYGRVYLDGAYTLNDKKPFRIRCTNVFIYQLAGPRQLKMAQPDNCDFDAIHELETQPESLAFCRNAKSAGTFRPLDPLTLDLATLELTYPLDPDRDANGAGLIYFANFVCFLDYAERVLLNQLQAPASVIESRSTFWRRTGYFGNAPANDHLQIAIRSKAERTDGRLTLGFDYHVRRQSDQKLILVSSARKAADLDEAGQSWISSLSPHRRSNG